MPDESVGLVEYFDTTYVFGTNRTIGLLRVDKILHFEPYNQ